MGPLAVSSPVGLKNILIATDYSPASNRAIGFAAALAARFEATLYALHADEPVNYAVPAQYWKAERDASRIAAGQFGAELRKLSPGVKSEIVVAEGSAWQVINRTVKDKEIDLLVLGTRGRRGIPKFLLGSAAEEILRRATCPVLTVGPRALSWEVLPLEGAPILYVTDFSPEAYAAAPLAIAWACELNATLTLLHVLEDGAALNFNRPLEPTDAARHLLERLLPEDAGSRFAYRLQVERGQAAEKIVDTAEGIRAALIVAGARGPAGFPGATEHFSTSTLHKVIAQAPCAVLSAR